MRATWNIRRREIAKNRAHSDRFGDSGIPDGGSRSSRNSTERTGGPDTLRVRRQWQADCAWIIIMQPPSPANSGPQCRHIHLTAYPAGDAKSVLLYLPLSVPLPVLARPSRVWMQICFIRVSGMGRGPNTIFCGDAREANSLGYGETRQLRREAIACPKRKRREFGGMGETFRFHAPISFIPPSSCLRGCLCFPERCTGGSRIGDT